MRIITWLLLCLLTPVTLLHAGNAEKNIEAAYKALNQKDFEVFRQYIAPDFRGDFGEGQQGHEIDQFETLYKAYTEVFANAALEITGIGNNGAGTYYVEVLFRGKNSVTVPGFWATGDSATVTGIDRVVVNKQGRITSCSINAIHDLLSAVGIGDLTNPAVQTVREVYADLDQDNAKGFYDKLADNVVFSIDDPVLYPETKVFPGAQEAGKFIREWRDRFQYTVFRPVKIVADGKDVMVFVQAGYLIRSTQYIYNAQYIQIFNVVDGKITGFRHISNLQDPTTKQLALLSSGNLISMPDQGKTEALKEYCTTDFTYSEPGLAKPGQFEDYLQRWKEWHVAFPDLQYHFLSTGSDGRLVMTKGFITGTQKGPWMGQPAQGKQINVPFLILDEVDVEGKVRTRTIRYDTALLLNQMNGA